MHYMTLVGENWYSVRIGRMPVSPAIMNQKAVLSIFLVLPQESYVYLVKIAECQPKWSLSIIKYTRNATDFGSKFVTTVTENHL